MKTLKIVHILLMILIRFFSVTFFFFIWYWLIFYFIKWLYFNSWSTLLQKIVDIIVNITKSFFILPLKFISTDLPLAIFTWVIIIWVSYYFLFTKNAKFRWIGDNIKLLLWDYIFSIVFLIKSIFYFIKSKSFDIFYDSIKKYYKTSKWWINYFYLDKSNKTILFCMDSFLANKMISINDFMKSNWNNYWLQNNNEKKYNFFPYCEKVEKQKNWDLLFKLYRPKWYNWNNFSDNQKNTFLHYIWFNPDEYIVFFDYWSNIEIKISKIRKNKEILKYSSITKYFKKWYYLLWLDQETNEPIYYDISNWSKNLSLLLAWIPWQWKSSMLINIFTQIFLNFWSQAQFWITSIKTDLSFAKNFSNTIWYWDNEQDILFVSRMVLKEINSRNSLFKSKWDIRSITEFNEKFPEEALPLSFYVFDEISASFKSIESTLWNESLKEIQSNLSRISTTSRSVWIVLLWSVVNPMSEIFWKIWSETKNTLTPIAFNTRIKSATNTVFWDTQSNAEELDIWEATFWDQKIRKYRKIITPEVTEKDIDNFLSENSSYIVEKRQESNIAMYLFNAINKWELLLSDSKDYWISRREFDKISSEMQSLKFFTKSPDNHLILRDKDWLQKYLDWWDNLI